MIMQSSITLRIYEIGQCPLVAPSWERGLKLLIPLDKPELLDYIYKYKGGCNQAGPGKRERLNETLRCRRPAIGLDVQRGCRALGHHAPRFLKIINLPEPALLGRPGRAPG